MNVGNDLQLLGTADVKSPERTKRPDLFYLPEQLPAGRPDHWPSVVGEAEPAKKVPEVVQKVVASQGANDSPVHITGAPLVIGFEELFLRPAEEEKGEGDIIIGEDDLTMLAEKV
ncbi:hypothetical protein IFM51744_05898 [Aspergillus udagawae]|nr:hypothetical protein IFM51744_05898 [Aspergillus udagawae]